MDSFAKQPQTERQTYIQETASRRNSTATAVEKDFWVCWTLKHLFALEGIPELRFKGGTSLSKVFKLIDRFSEDIDISIDRAALGFTGNRDLANPELSNTARKELSVELRDKIAGEVHSRILPRLTERFLEKLGEGPWKLEPSAEADEEMTLLFHYPAAIEYKEYLRPQIKIEFGRGDQQPSASYPIRPFIAEEFPDLMKDPTANIRVLEAERTFWEKITLLHAENHRPEPEKLKPRMSRHWSDVAVMNKADRFADSTLSLELLGQVVRFKQIHFPAAWAHYEIAKPPTLTVVPNAELSGILKKDYEQMHEMFPTAALSFEEIIGNLKELEARLNKLSG